MSVRAADPGGQAIAEALEHVRYEVIPLAGVEERVLAHVPREIKLTVTASPTRGIETTIDLSGELAGHGYTVVPHLSARLVADRAHLEEILARLNELGLHEAFVIAGDVDEPAGGYAGAVELLEAMAELGHGLERVGITGYPESHPSISDEATIQAMFAKEPHASYIVSQVCFDPKTIVSWVARVRARGTHLPIYVGLPGAIDRAKLLRISVRIGVGESARFLGKHGNWLTRFFLPGGYSPGRLLDGLAPVLAEPEQGVAGFHVYTFNDLEGTERWRRQTLERLLGGD